MTKIHQEVQNECQRLDSALEAASSVMVNLSEEYSLQGDRYNRKRVGREMEQLENELTSFKIEGRNICLKKKQESSTSEESTLIETESDRCQENGMARSPDSRDRREWPPNLDEGLHPDSRELQDHEECLHNLHEGERTF